jgi:hypothetical protein
MNRPAGYHANGPERMKDSRTSPYSFTILSGSDRRFFHGSAKNPKIFDRPNDQKAHTG